jgi:GT2 family glycosyltransferase
MSVGVQNHTVGELPSRTTQVSIVIICWNDWKTIENCLRSVYESTHSTNFEIIVSDNASTDGSPALIRRNFPGVRIVENGSNVGFAKGNNAGIRAASAEYVLILNPDTIIHSGALDELVAFAERHPEAGGFGCRILNPDGTYQPSARLFPTLPRYWMAALGLRYLDPYLPFFTFEEYWNWHGDSERVIDWQSGCCVMFRRRILRELGGFDEQFFYHFEEVDLCRRVWNAGFPIVFTPDATITHLGGQSVSRFPIRFQLEKHRSRYRYFYKHFGPRASRQCRLLSITWIRMRQAAFAIIGVVRPADRVRERLKMYRVVARWNIDLDPVRFVEHGEEPQLER